MKIAPINYSIYNNYKNKTQIKNKALTTNPIDTFEKNSYAYKNPNDVSFKGVGLNSIISFFSPYIKKTKNSDVQQEKFSYKLLSSKKPIYEPLNCNFKDIEKFSKAYSNKLNSQLMPISKQDVERLVLRVEKATKAPKELVREVLYKLTLYSNYDSLSKIQSIIDRYSILTFGINCFNNDNQVYDSSFNTLLNYLAAQKRQMNLFIEGCGKQAVMLDDRFLSMLEKCKNSNNSIDNAKYTSFLNEVLSNHVEFINLPGWDVKCSDGRYRSANMFCGSGYLEDVAVDVVTRVQKGENLDDILYSDFSQRLNKLLESDIDVRKIQTEKSDYKINDIYANLKIKTFTPFDIKTAIEQHLTHANKFFMARALKYIDKSTFIFSPDSFALNLQNLNEKIKQKYKSYFGLRSDNDIIYVVLDNEKSFAYVTNVFAKINDIDTDNVVGKMIPSQWDSDKYRNRHKIVLDDVSASGKTLEGTISELEYLSNSTDNLFACLVLSDSARHVKRYFGSNDTNFLTANVFDFSNLSSYQDNDTKRTVKHIIENNGYQGISSVCAFPYMIPDSNSIFASILFSKLLYKNSLEANKGLDLAITVNPSKYGKYIEII